MHDLPLLRLQTPPLSNYINIERVSVLAFHPQLVLHLPLAPLLQLDDALVLIVDEGVALELAVGWLYFHLAGVALASKVELDHGNAKELSVAAYVSWHGHLRVLDRVCLGEGLEALRRVAHGCDGNVLDDEVGVLEVGLSVLGTEEELKVNVCAARDLALRRLDPVVRVLILKRYLLLILLLVDAPMERNKNRRRVLYANDAPALACWICVLEVNGLEGVLLEVDFFAIDCSDVEVNHGAVASQLVKLGGLVIASEDQVLLELSFLFWIEGDVNIQG